jgi:hypothetical protein
MKTHPVFNTSLVNLKGEKWKEVFGYEMYFKISNYGRVKRLPRWVGRKNGATVLLKEKIIAPRRNVSTNKYVNEVFHYVICKFNIDKRVRYFSITRMVYYCFNKKFDIKDKNLFVIVKDGDNFSTHVSNLMLVTQKVKNQRMYDLDRHIAPFSNISKADKIKNTQKSIAITKKIISQYSLQGVKMSTYQSIQEAATAMGCKKSLISQVLTGQLLTCRGFIWRYGEAPTISVRNTHKWLKINAQTELTGKGYSIDQFDMHGKYLATFDSLKKASTTFNINALAIKAALYDKKRSAGGFYWKLAK